MWRSPPAPVPRVPPAARARNLEAWPWDLRIEALGGFGISRNGERLRPRRKAQKKVLEALRLLVAHGPDGMRQNQLADALWPDAEGDAGHRALGTTIYRARKLLGNAGAIVQRAGRVALDPGVVFVDAWVLERLAGEAAAARAGRNGRPLSQVQAQAMALHRRGELFGSECDELALSEARERLRRQVEACLRGA